MDDETRRAAESLRRGATGLARRLRAERPPRSEALLRLSVLAHLSRRGPMSPGAIATAERLRPQSLTRTLASLQHDALVSRHSDPADRRRSLLDVTDLGRDVLSDDMGHRDRWLAQAMARQLTPVERELLRLAGELMERLTDLRPEDVSPAPDR